MWWGKLGHTHLGVVGVVRPRPPRSDGVVRPRPLGVGERVGEGEVVILIYKTIYIFFYAPLEWGKKRVKGEVVILIYKNICILFYTVLFQPIT